MNLEFPKDVEKNWGDAGIMLKKRSTKSMNIFIIGCGKVGASLVGKLSEEGNDITVIDPDPEKIEAITNSYDVIGVVGSGANFNTLQEAGIEDADIFISVTGSDELNLLCCIVAKRASDCAAIARVRSPEYSENSAYFKDKLGLAMIINPDMASADKIARNLSLPTAIGVSSFARGRAEIVRIRVPQGNMLHGKRLMELSKELHGDVLICGVERDEEVYIPSGSFMLQSGDELSFVCPTHDSKAFLNRIGFDAAPAEKVMIVGGGRISYYLSKRLLNTGARVRILETNRARCAELSTLLPKAQVIYGDGTDAGVLRESGIEQADAVVALTGIDEENILLSLHAQEVSRAQVVTKINRIAFPKAIDRLDLGSVICPKDITTNAIVGFVRSRSAQRNSSIEMLLRLFDNRVEAIEVSAEADSPGLDIPLKDLLLKSDLLVACINRNGQILIPGGEECIRKGDSVIVVTKHLGLRELVDILE